MPSVIILPTSSTVALSGVFPGTAGLMAFFSATGVIGGASNVYYNSVTGFVGIGASTPAAELHVAGSITTSPRGVMSSQHNNGTDGARFHMRKSRGTIGVPLTIVTGDMLGRLVASGYDGANYLEMGAIEILSSGTIAATRIPTELRIHTATNTAPSVLRERMRITNTGICVLAGNHATDASALSGVTSQLQVKGLNDGGASSRTCFTLGNGGFTTPSALNAESNGDKWVLWNGTTYKGAIGFESYNMWFQSTSAASGAANNKFQWYGGVANNPVAIMQLLCRDKYLQIMGTGTPAVLPYLKYQSYDTQNTYIQNNIQNLSAGASASCDWICTADNGTDSINYMDMGISSSTYCDPAFHWYHENDGYILSYGKNLVLSTGVVGTEIVFVSGAHETARLRSGTLNLFDISKLSTTELATTWTNSGYETLTLAGSSITSAINTSLLGIAYINSGVAVVKDTTYVISFDITLNSGTLPIFKVAADTSFATLRKTNQPAAGTNTFSYTATATETVYFGLITLVASDFSVSSVSLKKSIGGDILAGGNLGIGTVAPRTNLDVVGSKTIAGATTDSYASSITLDPDYTAAAAQTVDRHNYMDIQQPSLTNVTVTDAAVMRFDAAAGTHKAVDSSSTKTTPTAVDAWIKINVNGTIYYVPAYTSKTA